MAEYIEREALIDRINETGYHEQIKNNLVFLARMLPAADVAPVRHGRWDDGSCTNCGWFGDCVDTPYYRYCPDCGVKMDLEGGTDG